MKRIALLFFILILNIAYAKVIMPPPTFFDDLKKSDYNPLIKSINKSIHESILTKKVTLHKLDEFLYLLTTPGFAYEGEDGNEKLGEDLVPVLGKFNVAQGALMSLIYNDLKKLNLPFKKMLTDYLLFPKEIFVKDIELAFYVDLNKLTGKIYNKLSKDKSLVLNYNSKNRFYRIEKRSQKAFYLFQIPNAAYEIVYTGAMIDSVIEKEVDEFSFIFSVIDKKLNKQLVNSKAVSFDGRYITGKSIFIDVWFLKKKSNSNVKHAKEFISKALKGKAVDIRGNAKK